MYEIRVLKEVKDLKKRLDVRKDSPLAIQIPEGLKQYSLDILDEFKEYSPILFVDPCYGACDLKDKEALDLGCTCLVHFGHASMNNPSIKIYFIPINYKFSKKEKDFLINEIKKLNFEKINLVTTINYLEEINLLKKDLKKEGITVLESRETEHIKSNMVLGCDSSTVTDKKHPIVYVGDGFFHPNNLGFIYKKEIYLINPVLRESKILNINDKFLKQRYGLVSKALNSKSFGILVSSKKGQLRYNLAKDIKKRLEGLGKKAYILVSDYIKEEYVLGIKIDCYVNTACPRLSYDDFKNFKKPIITPTEVSLLEDINKEYEVDQITSLEK